ncbi:MAG: hypothetical protein JO287_26835 [Pseudonocardiales bacterium]|nr:hypothetical protein [Pseudonocardiales bacterium]
MLRNSAWDARHLGYFLGYACWNYFDTLGMQRRMDYLTEVNGSTLVGHYTSRYQTFNGLLVATRRRVFRRNPDNTVDLSLSAITHDVELIRCEETQLPP